MNRVTFGVLSVIVPVLSNITVSIFESLSMELEFLISIPSLEEALDEMRRVIGAASPIAQGHAMTTTETNTSTEIMKYKGSPRDLK